MSIYTYALNEGLACNDDNLNNPGSALIPIHSLQVLSLLAVIFFLDNKYQYVDHIYYGGLLAIPLVVFIYIAIATAISAEGLC